MGCFDIYCLLCGNPCSSRKYNDDINLNDKEFKIFKKNTDWLYNCTILTLNNEIIHNCVEINCNDQFIAPNKNEYIASLDRGRNKKTNYGLFIHDDCWTFIKNKYGIKLKFGDLLANTKKTFYTPLSYLKYGKIEKYWGQDFDFETIINDNNIWMYCSPLITPKNAKRINHVIKQMKIKKGRKGPTLSASFYKSGIIKFGNNNKFWITKYGKWIEMKGEIKTTKVKLEKKHYKIPQLGETNTKPIFIKEFLTEKKKDYVVIISLE